MGKGSSCLDLTSKTFGRLTVLCKNGRNRQNRVLWKCLCLCGGISKVTTASLRSGNTKSCGCLQRERVKKANSRGSNKKIKIGNAYKLILECYDGNVRGYTFIDVLDWEKIKDKRWFMDGDGYAVSRPTGSQRLLLSRFLMGLGYKDKNQVDHIDGNRLNNRRSNLRVVTSLENKQNITVVRSKTGYKGVYQFKNGFVAEITVNKKRYRLGYFRTAGLAALAYNRAARKLCPFRKLNTFR